MAGDFPVFSGGNLLDIIDFDDLFVGSDNGDVLPYLEMDPELLAEFSASGGEEYKIVNVYPCMWVKSHPRTRITVITPPRKNRMGIRSRGQSSRGRWLQTPERRW